MENTCPELSWWIWNPAPWTPYVPDRSGNCSGPTTTYSARAEQVRALTAVPGAPEPRDNVSPFSRQQLGQGSLHGRSRAGGRRHGRGAPRSRELRLPARVPAGPFAGRRHGVRHGHAADIEDPRGVPRPHNEHVQRGAVAEGVGHRGGALQRHVVRPPAGGEYGRDVLHRQRGPVRHLLQDSETVLAHVRRSQPFGLGEGAVRGPW